MREKWKKYVEKFKSLGDKVSGVKGITAVIPAVCLAVLMAIIVIGGFRDDQCGVFPRRGCFAAVYRCGTCADIGA